MNRNVLVFHLPEVGPNIIHLEIKRMFSGIHRRVITITGIARTFYGHAGNKKVCCMRKSTTFKSGLRYCLFIGIELCVFADMSAKVFSNNWNLSGIARTNISFFKNKLVIFIQKNLIKPNFLRRIFQIKPQKKRLKRMN